MSKVRVYELARELDLEHTVVEQRSRELGIPVENHLAQLTPEQVEQVKRALQEQPGGEVTEKRVKKTVIRRRRKGERRRGASQQGEESASAGSASAEGEGSSSVAPGSTEPQQAEAPDAEGTTGASGESEQAEAREAESAAPEATSAAAEARAPESGAVEAAEQAPEPSAEDDGRAAAASRVAETTEVPAEASSDEGTSREPASGEGAKKGDEGQREAYAQVVGRIDPSLQDNIDRAQKRTERAAQREKPRGPARRAEDAPLGDRSGKPGSAQPRKAKKRRGGRVAYDRDKDFGLDDSLRGKKGGRSGRKRKSGQEAQSAVPKASKRVVKMEDTITVGELAQQLSVKSGEIIKYMMQLGEMVTVNNVLDLETVKLVAEEYGFRVENVAFNIEDYIPKVDAEKAERVPRAPVVTVMGHVDHGKTTLLDDMRRSRVASGEAGGITQHIGAYRVPVEVGGEEKSLVFLDTPGHEAFTQMRARGAQLTDVVILVTAADDGVMPQTVEAINHAKAAGVPLVVAVNKCDKDDADPQRIRRELTEHGLVPEEWGGDVQVVDISAKEGLHVDQLLEAVHLQAELVEPTAVQDAPAQGVVVEAELSRGRGPVATVLIHQGTLSKGDTIVAGKASGRVRALIDDQGQQVDRARPSEPVQVLGFNEVPPPSEPFYVVDDDKKAREIVEHLEEKEREKRLAGEQKRVSLEDLQQRIQEQEVKPLSLILKADVQGSLEALRSAVEDFEHPEVEVRVVHGGVGPISESDVTLAAASEAVVIGFNIRPEKTARRVAEQEGVELRLYSVIYEVLDDVRASLEGMLSPIVEEHFLGKAAVREVFKLKRAGVVAGCAVLQGKLVRGQNVRVIRDGTVIHEDSIDQLKRYQEDVDEVERGHECGCRLGTYRNVQKGDEIECYERLERPQSLDAASS